MIDKDELRPLSTAIARDRDEFKPPPRSIAVVSGKGGSGKTMIASVMAEIADAAGEQVILVDADTGTAGLSFYLGLELVANTAVGVSNLLTEPITSEKVIGCLQPVHSFKYTSFLSAGDRRTTLAN